MIVNNGYLGMVRQWQDMFFDERFSEVHLTHAHPGLREAGGGVRRRRPHGRDRGRARGALAEALSCGRTAVVDARVDPREHCFPMIPAGAAALDLVEYEEPERVEAA